MVILKNFQKTSNERRFRRVLGKEVGGVGGQKETCFYQGVFLQVLERVSSKEQP